MRAILFFVYTIIIPQTVFSVQGQNVEFSPSLRALYSEECPLYWKVPPLCVKIKCTTAPHRPRKELALTKHAKFRISFQYNSPVVLTFFLLSLGALALDGPTGGWTTTHLFCVYRSSLKDPLFYLRLFGHVLGHADLEHFLSNMLLFLVVGPPMEEKYGSVPLLQAIVLTAFVSGVLQCILFPGVALLGASGIVFMLIMLASLSGGTGGIPVTMLLVAALYLGDQIYAILFVQDNVANFMHIVGGVCGTAFGFYSAYARPRRRRR